MPIVAVNVIKVLFVAALYAFLFHLARAMRPQLARPEPTVRPREQVVEEAPPPAPQKGPLLRMVAEDGSARLIEVADRLVVGRSESVDVRLDDEFASDQHAAFWVEGSVVWVEDLASTNGTKLDGRPISEPVVMPPGSTVTLGRTTVTLK